MSSHICFGPGCNNKHPRVFLEGHDTRYPWKITYVCPLTSCGAEWFVCNGSCGIHTTKIIFYPRQLQRHQRDCHTGKLAKSNFKERSLCVFQEAVVAKAGLKMHEGDEGDDQTIEACFDQENLADDVPVAKTEDWNVQDYTNQWTTSPAVPMETKFKNHMVRGEADIAASVLVASASWQTVNPKCLPASYDNIALFLYLSKLVVCIGQWKQETLSKAMEIMYPIVAEANKSWSPIPSTMSGFRSKYINTSNRNSIASILPIPTPTAMLDGHGYTSFRSI